MTDGRSYRRNTTQGENHDIHRTNHIDRKRGCCRIAIGNRQSAIGNRQSAIGNRQSAIPLLCLIFCAALLTSGSQNATAETSHSVIPAQAGIQTQTQPRHSRAEGAGIQHSRESAPALAGAKAGIQLRVLPLQLLDNRYRDYVGFPPLLRSGENDGKSFSDFYRASQIELLSTLDNVLSQKAEDTLTKFAAVKKADVQLQTQLGNRKGQIAANVIGAFAESQSTAFGWQVRVFGAENDTKGANAGIFFRRVDGESLYGVNTFADYEKGDYGEFLRYGIGGELQNRYVAFAANLYLPITDDKHTGSTVAFSQKGYDANLRINIPQLDFLKVAADYYHFDGKYGGENDNGFRYGLELQPIANLWIGAFYDDGGEKFGGDIAYIYNIAPPQKRELTEFAPDLFSPILREYSQRIITATTGPGISLRVSAVMTTFTTMTAELITRTTTFSTMAGVETRTTTEMTVPSRRASVNATVQYYEMPNFYVVISTGAKYLVTLPSMTTTRPWVITAMLNLDPPGNMAIMSYIVESNFSQTGGNPYAFANIIALYTLTVVQGSEERIGMMTLTTRTTTTEDIITAMTMAMTMQGMTIITAMTAFSTMTITLGLPTTTGAAIDNSHFPPSFPPSSFPQMRQMPKLALAANPRIFPSFPRPQLSFPRRRESTRRRAANTDGAKRHLTIGGKAAAF